MNNSKFSHAKSQNQTTDEKYNEKNNKKNKYEAKFLNSGTKTGLSGISGIKKAVAIGLAAASAITLSGEANATAYTAAANPANISWNVDHYEIAVGRHFGVGNNTKVFAADTFNTGGANVINFKMEAGRNTEIDEIIGSGGGEGTLFVNTAAAMLTVKKVNTSTQAIKFWINDDATLFFDLADKARIGAIAINGSGVSTKGASIFRIKGDYNTGAGAGNAITFNGGIDSAAGDGVLIVDGTGPDATRVGAVIFQGQVGANAAVEIKIGGTRNDAGAIADNNNHAILQFDTDANAVKTNGVTFYSSDSKLIIERAAPVGGGAPVGFIATNGIKSEAGIVANTKGGGGILELKTTGAFDGDPANGLVVKQEIGKDGAGLKGIELIGTDVTSLILFEEDVNLGGDGVGAGNAGSNAFLTVNIAKTTLADQKSIYVGGDGGNGGAGGNGTVTFNHAANAMTFKLGGGVGASIFRIGGVGGDGAGAGAGAGAGGNGGDAFFTLAGNTLTITGDHANTKLLFGGKGGVGGGNGGAGGNATLNLSKDLTLGGKGSVRIGGWGGAGANGGNGGNGGAVTINVSANTTLKDTTNHKFKSFGGKGGAGAGDGDGGKGGDLTINLDENLTLDLDAVGPRPFGGTGGDAAVGAGGNGGKGGDFTLNFNGNNKSFVIQNSVSPLGGTGGQSNANGAAGGNATIKGADNAASTLILVANSIIGGAGGAGANGGNGGDGGIGKLQLRGNNFLITNAVAVGGTGGKADGNGTGGAGGIGIIELSGANVSTLTLAGTTKIGGTGGNGVNRVSGAGGAGYLVGSYNGGINPTATAHALKSTQGLQFGNDGTNAAAAVNTTGGAGGIGFVHLGANISTVANDLVIGGKGGAGTNNDSSRGGAGGKGTLKISGASIIAPNGVIKIGGAGGASIKNHVGATGGAGGEGIVEISADATFSKALTIGGAGGAGGGVRATGGAGGNGTITATGGVSTFANAVTIGGNAGAGGASDGGNGTIVVDNGATLKFENALTLGGAKTGAAGTVGESIVQIKNGTVTLENAFNIKDNANSKIELGNDATHGTLVLQSKDARDLKEFKSGIEFKSLNSTIQYKTAGAAGGTLILPTITTGGDNTPKGILEIDANAQDITVTSAKDRGAIDQEFAIGAYVGAGNAGNRSLKQIIIKNSDVANNDKTFTFKNSTNNAGIINSDNYTIDCTGLAGNGHTLKFEQNGTVNPFTVVGNVVTTENDRGILSLVSSNDAGVLNFIGNIGTVGGAGDKKLKGLSVTTNDNAGSQVKITGNVFATDIKLSTQGGSVTFSANGQSTEITGNIAQDINNYNLVFDTATNNTITLDGTIDANANSVKITNTGGNADAKTIFKKKSYSAVKIDNNATLEINPNVDIADFAAIDAAGGGNCALVIDTATNSFTTNAIGGANTIKTLLIQGTQNTGFNAVTLSGADTFLTVSATGTNNFVGDVKLNGNNAKVELNGGKNDFGAGLEIKGNDSQLVLGAGSTSSFGGAVSVGADANNPGTIEINRDQAFTAAVSIGNGAGAGKLIVKKGNVTFNDAAKPTLGNKANSQILIGDAANDASVSIESNGNYQVGGANTTDPVKLTGTGATKFAYKLTGHADNHKSLTFGSGVAANRGIYADADANSTFEVINDTANNAGTLTIDGHVGYKGDPVTAANAAQITNFNVSGQGAENSVVLMKGDVNVKNLKVEKSTFKLYDDDAGGRGDAKLKAESVYGAGTVEVKDGEFVNPNADQKVVLGTDANALDTIKFVNTADRTKDKLSFKNVGTLEYNSAKKLTLLDASFVKLDKINFSADNGSIVVREMNDASGKIDVLSSTDANKGDFTMENVYDRLSIGTVGQNGARFKNFTVGQNSQFKSKAFITENVKVATGSSLIADLRGNITNLTLENNAILNARVTGYDVDTLTAQNFVFGLEIDGVTGTTMSTGSLKLGKNPNVTGNVTNIALALDSDAETNAQMATLQSISANSDIGVESNQIFDYVDSIKVDAFEKSIEIKTDKSTVISAKYDPKTRRITTKLDAGKIEEAAKEQAKEIDNAVKNVTEETRQVLEDQNILEEKVNALQEFNFSTESAEFAEFNKMLISNPKSDAGQLGALLNTIKEGGADQNNQAKKVRIAELVASIDLDQIAEQVTAATASQVGNRVDDVLNSAVTDAVTDSFSDEMDISASSPIEVKYSASGDDDARKTGLWMKSFLGSGEKKHETGVSGFKSDIKGITIGVDTAANDRLIVGGAITFAGTNMKMKEGLRDGNKVSTNSKVFSLYGSYALGNNVFFSLIGSYGSNTTEVTEDRATLEDFDNGQRKDVKSEYGSNMYSVNTKLTYKHVADNLVLTPSVGLNFARANDESYSEKGIDTAKTYDSKYLTRVNLVTGAKAAYNFGNIVPEVHVNLTQKVAGKDAKVGYKLDGFGDFRYSENVKKLAATTYNVGGSITYKTDVVNVGVGVDGNFASKYTGYQGSLNLRIKM